MSLELHVETVGALRADPTTNSIRAIFYQIHRDIPPDGPQLGVDKRSATGIIISPHVPASAGVHEPLDPADLERPTTSTSPQKHLPGSASHYVAPSTYTRSLLMDDADVTVVATELDLIQEIVKIVTSHDPDFLVGHEVQMASWGFLIERAHKLGIKLCHSLSRVPGDAGNYFRDPQEASRNDEFFLKIVGRDILNLSQLLRHELALYNYSFENLAYHVLHQRIPLYSFESLTAWFNHPASCWRTIQHYLIRVKGNVSILEQLNFVGRTSELARLFGIQFHEVFDRGTQFRVESMMLRLAKLQNYVSVSPSPQQRASMRAPEHLALILEPQSRYFTNPVVVLDFQSLYPSMMIAYNYCFSTCLGRVDSIGNPDAFQFGCTSLKIPLGLVKKLMDKFTVSPCGIAFVKSEVRKGILPQMLEDILAVRIMVKLAMKKYKGDKALTRMLDARQLGLKLIANVTYGYTSANFSGRMPCVEIADSVVSKGRETLERAIATIKATERWGGKVIYGDTDSVFVLLEGRTKEQAFAIGQEIADVVTADNPKPVKLKLEKVYMPCLLETKKRYVGFMYESPDQVEPTYEAKGIETVRRDGCPAVAKILEKMLRTLFRTHDMTQVKRYVQRQFEKIITGRSGMSDFIFTRKYRGRSGYRMDSAPALRIARRLIRCDPRSEPRVGERVPYVVIYGSPGTQLMDLVRHPHEVLRNSDLRLNATYYITRAIIPALNRVITLVGDDVNNWYITLSRTVRAPLPYERQTGDGGTIARYFVTTNCPVCDTLAGSAGICEQCKSDPQATTLLLTNKIRNWEKRFTDISKVCQGCSNSADNRLDCISTDCPILFRRFQSNRDLLQAPYLLRLVKDLSLDW